MTIDVLDYLGKHEDGILVLVSLGYEGEYYEEALLVLTVDEKLEQKLECPIEDWSGYQKLMYDLIRKVVPYEEMINRIDEFNPSEYGLFLDSGTQSN